MRRCSRTRRPMRTVPFASYQCQKKLSCVHPFHLRLYRPFQFMTLLVQIRSWYYSCCGKSICKGCVNSCRESGNDDKCPFCNSDRCITSDEAVEEIRSRAAANDPTSMILLGHHYFHGKGGVQRDQAKAIKLYAKAVDLGHGKAHFHLADVYHKGGESKKARFHYGAAAMAGHDNARINLGILEAKSGNIERAIKHWTIAASSGHITPCFN